MHFEHTHIREIRVSYPRIEHERFVAHTPEDVATFVRTILPENSREHFLALYLDTKHRIAGYSLMSIGSADQCLVPGPEIFQRALIIGAQAIILSHNHPAGSLEPSAEDWRTTKRLIECGKILGVRILDHVIVTDESYTSLREQGGSWD